MWKRRARGHARCGQIFLVLHHALLIPSILVPPAVSIFDAPDISYSVVAASLAAALSLSLKLELRAYHHAKAARDYAILAFDARHGDVRAREAPLIREAPMLPVCICGNGHDTAGQQGEAGAG